MIFDTGGVLVLGAHADDETIGAGGTIARLRDAQLPVTVAIATDSTSAQYPGDADAARRRHAHFMQAMHILGVTDTHQGDFPDMRLGEVAHVALNAWVAAVIDAVRPATVLVHHPGDVNADHGALARSTLVATRPVPGQCVKALYTYHTSSSTEWGFGFNGPPHEARVHVDISATLQRKLDALAAYRDEQRAFPHPRSIEALRALAQTLGSSVGVAAAEGLHCVRAIV